MRILIVEDDAEKAKSIESYISEKFSSNSTNVVQSYHDGVEYAMNGKYDIIILDMSIPAFEGQDSCRGETLKNGGEIIVRELLDEDIKFRCLVITQYETFNNESLETIDKRLRKLCGNSYLGCIKYDTYNDDWKDKLKNVLENVFGINN